MGHNSDSEDGEDVEPDHSSISSFDPRDFIMGDDDGLEYLPHDICLWAYHREAEIRDDERGSEDEDEMMPWIM